MLLKWGMGSQWGREVLERVVSGNLHKNPKWLVRIIEPGIIEKHQNST